MNSVLWFNSLAAGWAQWMFPMAWQVAVLALIIWGTTCLLGKSSATFRHALWLLVFLRLVLPPTLAMPWSIGGAVNTFPFQVVSTPTVDSGNVHFDALSNTLPTQPVQNVLAKKPESGHIPPATIAMTLWFSVSLFLFALLLVQNRKYTRRAMRDCMRADQTLQALVDVQRQALGVRYQPTVLISPHTRIPAVVGFWNATILLPQSILDLSDTQQTNIIGHELAHIRRHDILLGWFISLLLCCYWFHPVVWFANLYIRREREMACDDAVLYASKQEGKEYAATIVRMAESFDNTVPVGAGFLGMLELSDNLLLRIRSTLDATRARRFTWRSGLALCLFMILFIPMGVWQTPATAEPAATAPTAEKAADETPQIVFCTPANGATEVDPALDRIVVVFDQDMAPGFSWTGGKPFFPETTGKPKWIDARTCELPVRLEAGKLYRFGINSSSYQNFKSTSQVPVDPQAFAFTTQGADATLVAALTPPKVIALSPDNGAKGVDPAITQLSVTFDRPMGGGMSWVRDDIQKYPETTGKVTWSDDHLTCTMPVKLYPKRSYLIWLNAKSFNNFQSEYGVSLIPVKWTFETR